MNDVTRRLGVDDSRKLAAAEVASQPIVLVNESCKIVYPQQTFRYRISASKSIDDCSGSTDPMCDRGDRRWDE